MRKYLLLAGFAAIAFAQSLKFEVASIKPVMLGKPMHIGITLNDARVDIGYWSLRQLILRAYDLPSYQLSAPQWLDEYRFDIAAKLPEGAQKKQLPQMLQSLLKDRFGFSFHRETKNLPGYQLALGKDGTRLKAAVPDPNAPPRPTSQGEILDSLYGDGTALGATVIGPTRMEFKRLPMGALAQILSSQLNAPVIDSTDLKGDYQVTLDSSSSAASDPTGTATLSAVQRLGLKFDSKKISVLLLVVDRIERVPIAN